MQLFIPAAVVEYILTGYLHSIVKHSMKVVTRLRYYALPTMWEV